MENTAYLILGTLSIGAACIILVLKTNQKHRKKKFPTFKGGNFLTGHMSDILKEPGRNFGAVCRRLSQDLNTPAGYITMLCRRKLLCITSYEVAKEVFVTNGKYTSGRAEGLSIDLHMADRINYGIVTIDGPNWKNNRKVFHNQLRAFSKDRLFQIIQTEAGYLTDALEAACRGGAAGAGVGVEPSDLLQKAVSNITCTLLFGSRYDYHDKEFTQTLEALMKYNSLHRPTPYVVQKLNRYFKFSSRLINKEKCMNVVTKFCRRRIEERLRQKADGSQSEVMIDAFLVDYYKSSGNPQHIIDNLVVVIFELFFAGTETTSTTLLWALQYLTAYPDVQSRVREEIDSVIGYESTSESSLKFLSFFSATQLEIQRVACIALVTITHRITEDFTLSTGETLSKNERVAAIIYAIHRDPKYWKHPEEFNPDNFLDDKGEFVKNEAFFTYGQGPRVCLGEKIADLELKLFLIAILQKLTFSCCESIDTSVRVPGFTSSPEKHSFMFSFRQ